MAPFRIVFIVGVLSVIGGASYLSYSGVWGESRDVAQSIRVGSGGGFTNARVK